MLNVIPLSLPGSRTTHWVERRESTDSDGTAVGRRAYTTIDKLLIEKRIDSSQVFNMAKPSFTPKLTNRTVFAFTRY